MTKKLPVALLLISVLKLNCATNSGAAITDELLGVDKPSAPSNLGVIKAQLVPAQKSDICRHWHPGGGLADSDSKHVAYIQNVIANQNKIDASSASWRQSFLNLLKGIYSYFFSYTTQLVGSTVASADSTVVKEADTTLGVNTSSSVSTTIIGPTATFTSANGIDILKGMTFSPAMVYDQGTVNACTANVMAFIIRYNSVLNSSQPTVFSQSNSSLVNPSRGFHYYNETKLVAGKTGQNASETVSAEQAIFALDKYGTCPENTSTISASFSTANQANITISFGYPVPDSSGNITAAPPTIENYRYALDASDSGLMSGNLNPYAFVAQKIRYSYIGNNVTNMKAALSQKQPIFTGFRVYSAFVSKANYPATPTPFFVPLPTDLVSGAAQKYQGGHAMVIVGWGNYNSAAPTKNYFKVLNSWGSTWGDCGFCYFPEEYISGQAIVNNSSSDPNYLNVVTTASLSTTTYLNTVTAYSIYFAN